MNSDWPVRRLGDYSLKIGSGATPKGGKAAYLDCGAYKLIRSQNIYNNGFSSDGLANISEVQAKKLGSVTVEAGDILLNITGDSVTRVCQAPEKYLPARVNQHVAIIRPDPNVFEARFLRYFLASPIQQGYMLQLAASGATRNALTKGMVEKFLIPCPPITEQRAIAYILGTLDEKIELNRRMNKTLEAMARALFKDWFIDFGPVRAKMQGREPYLPRDLWRLFPADLDNEEKPQDWEEKTLGEDFVLTMGQSPPGESYNDVGNGLPFFQGRTDFRFRYPKRRKYCTDPTRLAMEDDTLVSVRAPVGDINLAWEKCCIGRGLAAIRHKSGSRSFTYGTLHAIQDQLKVYEHTGTVFGAINKKQFENLRFIDPGNQLIEAFEKITNLLDNAIRANTTASEVLVQLRDVLLPKLISGEIRIKDAERIIRDTT